MRAGLLRRGAKEEHVRAKLLQISDTTMNAEQGKECHKGQKLGVDFLSMISFKKTAANSAQRPIRAVWVKGYPRSGTSTTLSLVSSSANGLGDYTTADHTGALVLRRTAEQPAKINVSVEGVSTSDEKEDQAHKKLTASSLSHTFALFEPCHDGDKYDPWLEETGCGALLSGLAVCNFTGVHNLWGWDNPHTTNMDDRTFSQDKATQLCGQADLVTFKTVDDRHSIREWTWLLDQQPHMRILDMVRDPRGIWASWKSTTAFNDDLASGTYGTLTDICRLFAANLDFKDNRVHRVVFEHMVKDPKTVAKGVYDFLEMPFTQEQNDWIRKTFNAKECPPHMPWFENYTDCHTESSHVVEKWRSVLSKEELQSFYDTPECIQVIKAYNYPRS